MPSDWLQLWAVKDGGAEEGGVAGAADPTAPLTLKRGGGYTSPDGARLWLLLLPPKCG